MEGGNDAGRAPANQLLQLQVTKTLSAVYPPLSPGGPGRWSFVLLRPFVQTRKLSTERVSDSPEDTQPDNGSLVPQPTLDPPLCYVAFRKAIKKHPYGPPFLLLTFEYAPPPHSNYTNRNQPPTHP